LKTALLIALRKSRERLYPSIQQRMLLYPKREPLIRFLRVLTPLSEIPFYIRKESLFFLDEAPRPNSKSENIVKELVAAGVKRDAIWTKSSSFLNTKIEKLVRISLRIPNLLLLFFHSRSRLIRLDLVDLQIVLGYWGYKKFFEKNKKLVPIIISDVSPLLNMQWSAIVSLDREIVYWQEDYHHTFPLPYCASHAVVINQGGLEAVKLKYPYIKVYQRPQITVSEMRKIPGNPTIGVAVNVLFKATFLELQNLDNLRLIIGADIVKVRLHPNSTLKQSDIDKDWIVLANKDETLDQFASSIDLAVVGNSAIQLKLLCLGTPVIHVPFLDPLGFDVYRYCEMKFAYGMEAVEQISFTDISEFYSDPALKNRLSNFVNIHNNENVANLNQLQFSLNYHERPN
jgi:hypothetical protein